VAPPEPAPQQPPAPSASGPQAAASEALPPPDPSKVSVIALAAPAKLAVDGDLGEWGSLAPPPADPEAAPEARSDQDNASSHVALAVSGEALLLAADLRGAAREGAWIAVVAGAPNLPRLGPLQSDGSVRDVACGDFNAPTSANSARALESCRRREREHERTQVRHEARFSRVFRADAQGVRERTADGKLVPVAGASAVWKPSPEGARFEASLPLSAMPRLSEAPLTTLWAWSQAATASQEPRQAQETRLSLPQPVSFEPHGTLRSQIFASVQERYNANLPALSYQPGTPAVIESWKRIDQGMAVVADEGQVFKKLETLGDVEVGIANVFATWLVVLKNGKPVGDDTLIDFDKGATRLIRGGELHIFSSSSWFNGDTVTHGASWSVFAINGQGKIRRDVLVTEGTPSRWIHPASFFSNKEMKTFGLRGVTMTPQDKPWKVEVTWRWDDKKQAYLPTLR